MLGYGEYLNIHAAGVSMKVIWKRPDGFHNASPEDYKVVTLKSGANVWLHKTNTEWYPFRVSGDWSKEEGTTKLNKLINLLGEPSASWSEHLLEMYFDSESDNPKQYASELLKWLNKVKDHLKGDTWELDIMEQVVSIAYENIKDSTNEFIEKSNK